MKELILNIEPIGFGLMVIGFLYYNHVKTRKQWDKKPPKVPSHLVIRSLLANLTFAVIFFVASVSLTTSLIYTIMNTVILTGLASLLFLKIMADAKKFHSNSKS